MAIRNVGGHGTTSVLGSSAGQEAKKAQPQFTHTQGPAVWTAPGTAKQPTGSAQKKK